jgi:hypothetical protein
MACKNCKTCKNPVQFWFDRAIEQIEATPGLTFENILEEGTIYPYGQGVKPCCPDCGIYVLSNLETWVTYSEATGGPVMANPPQGAPAGSDEDPCCVNYAGTAGNFANFASTFEDTIGFSKFCCNNNNFNDCVNKLVNSVKDGASFLERGVVEYGTVKENSLLCKLVDLLSGCDTGITDLQKTLTTMLDLGFVIFCTDEGLLVASIEEYLKYIEAIPVN